MVQLKLTSSPTIVTDFICFLDYLSSKKIKLTAAKQFINRKDCFALNQLMAHPQADITPRSDQNHYPLLHLFATLLKVAPFLMEPIAPSKSTYLKVDSEKIRDFKQLHTVQQYFMLLGIFWVQCDWKKAALGKKIPFCADAFDHFLVELNEQKVGAKTSFKQIQHNQIAFLNLGSIGWYLHFFGIWDCLTTQNGNCYRRLYLDKVAPTSFGKQLLPILSTTGQFRKWNNCYQKQLQVKSRNAIPQPSNFDITTTLSSNQSHLLIEFARLFNDLSAGVSEEAKKRRSEKAKKQRSEEAKKQRSKEAKKRRSEEAVSNKLLASGEEAKKQRCEEAKRRQRSEKVKKQRSEEAVSNKLLANGEEAEKQRRDEETKKRRSEEAVSNKRLAVGAVANQQLAKTLEPSSRESAKQKSSQTEIPYIFEYTFVNDSTKVNTYYPYQLFSSPYTSVPATSIPATSISVRRVA